MTIPVIHARDIPEHLIEELLAAVDLAISTGARIRSDPGTHELSLAMLCNVMGRIVAEHGGQP